MNDPHGGGTARIEWRLALLGWGGTGFQPVLSEPIEHRLEAGATQIRAVAVEHFVANPIVRHVLAVLLDAGERGTQRVLGAEANDRRRREPKPALAPRDLRDDLPLLPVEHSRCVSRDRGLAGNGGTHDAEGLPRADLDVVFRVVVASGDGVRNVARVRDAVLVVDLVTSARVEAGFVHFDDVPRPFEQPFHAATAARLTVLVVHGGDEHDLRAERRGRIARRHVQATRFRVEVAEESEARLGVRLFDAPAGQHVGDVTGVVGIEAPHGGGESDDQR